MRHTAELSALFVIVVILLRGFVLEGYLISTGSMAPNLLGFHKRIICPTCDNLFAFGVTFDDSVDPVVGRSSGDSGLRSYATCPNCGQVNINVSKVPNAHGDQLLVHKHVYDFRSPYRWEIVVFRSPHSPGEAFVKRVVGLPGEQLLVREGDLFVNGRRTRRPVDIQRAMRLLVSDFHHLAEDDDWEMSWHADKHWEQSGDTLVSHAQAGSDQTAWIQFRNWRWHGGDHFVETPLGADDAQEAMLDLRERFRNLPVSIADRIEYDREREVLRCQGVMPVELQKLLLSRSSNKNFHAAIYRIAALSHLAPVTDHYGYNSMVTAEEHEVRDLMMVASVSWDLPPDAVVMQVPVENETYEVRLDIALQQITLSPLSDPEEQVQGRFSIDTIQSAGEADERPGIEIEVSNFDRQILVAVNGQTCLPPMMTEADLPPDQDRNPDDRQAPFPPSDAELAGRTALLVQQQQRWKLGVTNGEARLESLKMYRDVYYTPGRRINAVDREYIVPPDSYFVQGDNSPVSSDSRNWTKPAVPHEMLLGKPFLVHLPSYPATLSLGDRQIPIRIPDFSRIRYIR